MAMPQVFQAWITPRRGNLHRRGRGLVGRLRCFRSGDWVLCCRWPWHPNPAWCRVCRNALSLAMHESVVLVLWPPWPQFRQCPVGPKLHQASLLLRRQQRWSRCACAHSASCHGGSGFVGVLHCRAEFVLVLVTCAVFGFVSGCLFGGLFLFLYGFVTRVFCEGGIL